jgi:hypothetical protein
MFARFHLHRFITIAIAVAALTASMIVPSSGQARRGDASPAQIPMLTSNVPPQVFPINGAVIPIKRVVYVWAAVPGATQYTLQVYQDSTRILNKSLGNSVCVSDSCAFRHSSDLANATYKWKIRATVGGVAQAFSPLQVFTVSVPSPVTGFYSPFTTDAVGWVMHKGLWYLESSNYFTTVGVQGFATTISHLEDYSALTYEVRMRRDGCIGNANVIAVRGNPTLDSVGWWNTEYTFDYTNNGYFSIWRDYYGTYTALRDWTYTSAIVQGGWNTLKVKASGPNLYFYINDILVWSGTDTSYASGSVGIGMYRGSGCTSDKLWVDYAKLDTTVADLPAEDIRLELGEPVPGGTRNTAP